MNNFNKIFFITILVSPFLLSAQILDAELKWTAISGTAGGGSAIYSTKVVNDGNGNVCACGLKRISNGPDFGYYTIKYDSLGNQVWANTYNTFAPEKATDCKFDINTGDVYVGGYTYYIDGTSKIALVKYSPSGGEQWVFNHSVVGEYGSRMRNIELDDEGNIYLIGTEYFVGGGDYLTVFKLSSAGELIWKNQYEETNSYGRYGGRLIDDKIVVLGYGAFDGGKYIIHQLNLSGETISTVEVNKEDEVFRYFTFGSDGSLYLGDEAREYKVTKISLEGDTVWHYELPVINPPTPNGVFARLTALEEDGEGNVFAVGPFYDNETGFGIVTTMLDENGENVWSQRYEHMGIETADSPTDIKLAGEYVIVVGETYLDAINGRDYLMVIYSKEGEELLHLSFDNNGNKYDVASSVSVSGENIYLTGYTSISGSVFDSTYILTQRYRVEGLVSAVEQQKLMEGVEVFPNPFERYVFVNQTEAEMFFSEYELYVVSGEIIAKGKLNSKNEKIEFPHDLKGGIYLLKLKSTDGNEMIKVLIKGG